MRRMLHALKWIGLSLSTLLLAATVLLWVRSLGHREGWRFARFEPRPDWTTRNLAGLGIERRWWARAIHGRLWLKLRTLAPARGVKLETEYWRNPISADEAKEWFDSDFKPGEWKSYSFTVRAWRFAGVGFSHRRTAIDRETGRPVAEGFDLALPFWMLAGVFGLWPLCFAARRMLRRKRYGAGLCPSCGYDLRATPQRCPECGRATASAAVEPKPAP